MSKDSSNEDNDQSTMAVDMLKSIGISVDLDSIGEEGEAQADMPSRRFVDEGGKPTIRRIFAEGLEHEEPKPVDRYRAVFQDFALMWYDTLADIKAIRASKQYDIGDL